jgi:hypothetical protein
VTGPRFARMERLLRAVPSSHAGGLATTNAALILASSARVPTEEVPDHLRLLEDLGLLGSSAGRLARSSQGDRLVRRLRQGDGGALAAFLCQSGIFAGQVQQLSMLLRITPTGSEAPLALARRQAPQLLGLLSRLEGVHIESPISLPSLVTEMLNSSWSQFFPPPPAPVGSTEERLQVGERAELYSLQRERSAASSPRSVLWVSREDSSAGYDIEVREGSSRRIEVKGSRGREVTFLLSSNELACAVRHGEGFELHFWGDVDLRQRPAQDYARLTGSGYPIVIRNPAATLQQEPWTLSPAVYRARRVDAASTGTDAAPSSRDHS